MARAPSEKGSEKICLGRVLGAHGVRGLVRVRAFTEEPENVAAYGPVETPSGKSFKIEALNILKDAVLCRFDGIGDRDQAEALKGTDLFVSRDKITESSLEEGEWYHADLLGLEVRNRQGEPIGQIVAVENFGAGDLIDIRVKARGQNFFLPFTDDNVPEINLGQNYVVIDPPHGWDDEGDRPEGDQG
jgi:16S rRNA processing protein RimM